MTKRLATCLVFVTLGMGCPELGYVNLQEIEEVKLPFGLKIERDMFWSPNKTLIEYWNESKEVA
jgi:hypothetical protein